MLVAVRVKSGKTWRSGINGITIGLKCHGAKRSEGQ